MLPLTLSVVMLVGLATMLGTLWVVKQRQRRLLAAMSARLTRLDGDKARLECALIPLRREVQEQRQHVADLREYYRLRVQGHDHELAADTVALNALSPATIEELERRSGLTIRELLALPPGTMVELLLADEHATSRGLPDGLSTTTTSVREVRDAAV